MLRSAPTRTAELQAMLEDVQQALKKPANQRSWIMAINTKKCSGCQSCAVACMAENMSPKLPKPFYSIIPLPEILSEILDCGPSAKKVTGTYEELLAGLGPELHILMDAPSKNIERAGGRLLAAAIDRMRESRVIRKEGYDGEYGVIRLFEEAEKASLRGQAALFHAPAPTPLDEQESEPVFSSLPARSVREAPEPYQTFLFDPVLDPLNPAQKEAVLHQGSHLLIVAHHPVGRVTTGQQRANLAMILRRCPGKQSQIALVDAMFAESLGQLLVRPGMNGKDHDPAGVTIQPLHHTELGFGAPAEKLLHRRIQRPLETGGCRLGRHPGRFVQNADNRPGKEHGHH